MGAIFMKKVDKIGIIYNPYSKKAFKAAINLVRDAKRLGISCVVDLSLIHI